MAVAGYTSQVLIASLPSIAFSFEDTDTTDLITFAVTNQAHRYFDKSVPVVTQKGLDEVQTVTITGSPTGGTFTLTFGGNTTTALNWNATASQVQSALQALASIGTGNMRVTGGPGPGTAFTCQFYNAMGQAPQALMTATPSFTGGSSPNVAIAEVTHGAALATITTGFQLFRCNARVVFTSVQQAGTHIKFLSGNYFPYAQIAEAASCEVAFKMNTDETTTFASATASSGGKSFTPTTLEATLKYGSFWASNGRLASLVARDYLIVSFVSPTGNRYEGFCYASDAGIKDDVNKVVTKDLVIQLTDEFFNS